MKPDANKKSNVEITVRVVVLGLILSVVMGAANVYVGLKVGMTVSASIPAAVMAMLLFRLLFRDSNILEANQVQTCASAGESLAAGIIFTMPALLLIGYWDSFDYWTVTIVAFTGGLLGILFMIPMRKVFVVNNDELKYPEGIACAAVLKAGEKGADESAGTILVIGGLLGALVKVFSSFFSMISGSLQAATISNSRIFYFGVDLSPMLIAVGFIVRLNVAILIFIGGAMTWLIGIPLLGIEETDPAKPVIEQAVNLWKHQLRYVGVGAMVVGGFSSLFAVRHGLIAAISHLWGGLTGKNKDDGGAGRDIPSWLILTLGLLCVALLVGVNYSFTQGAGITTLTTIVMLIMGFFFTAVASYIVGLVGNSNSPVSGMTITAVLVAGAMMYVFNYSGMQGMVATLGVAAIVCCIACTSGDVCNDLKTGSIVGASPYKQQAMQIAGVFVAAFVMAPIMNVLHNWKEIGSPELSAPQASLFASLAKGFNGEGELPWDLIGWGAGLGVVILIIDEILKRRNAKFRAHLMPIAVGMYLPFGLATPILIGGLIAHFYSRKKPESEHDAVLHRGVLFSSGIIAGEALTAVGIAGLAGCGIMEFAPFLSNQVITVISSVAAIGTVILFVIMARPKKD